MYTLTVDPCYTHVTPTPSAKLASVLDTALSFQPEQSGYIRNTKWDGSVHLYNSNNHYFPTGLLVRACTILKHCGYDYRVEYKMPNVAQNADFKFIGKLRDYQEEDLKKIDITNTKRGVIWAITGYGKTALMMATIAQIRVKPVIIFIDSADLMYQLAEAVKSYLGIEAGLFGDGHKDLSKDITIAIIDSVWESLGKRNGEKTEYDWKVFNFIKSIPVVITDECQSIPASSFYNTYKKMSNAVYRLGFSSTPYRADGYTMYIESAIGHILMYRSAEDLISRGYLAKPTIIVVPVKQINDIKWNSWERPSDDYKVIYDCSIVDNNYRHSLIVDAVKDRQNLPALVLIERIEHGHAILHNIQQAGFKSSYLKGDNDNIERRTVLQAFRENKLDVLIMSRIGAVGIDLPNIRCLIVAGGGKSSVITYQRIGRALRAIPGKDRVLIIDFRDYVKFLRGHADNRIKLYKDIGFETIVCDDINEVQRHICQYNQSKINIPTVHASTNSPES